MPHFMLEDILNSVSLKVCTSIFPPFFHPDTTEELDMLLYIHFLIYFEMPVFALYARIH